MFFFVVSFHLIKRHYKLGPRPRPHDFIVQALKNWQFKNYFLVPFAVYDNCSHQANVYCLVCVESWQPLINLPADHTLVTDKCNYLCVVQRSALVMYALCGYHLADHNYCVLHFLNKQLRWNMWTKRIRMCFSASQHCLFSYWSTPFPYSSFPSILVACLSRLFITLYQEQGVVLRNFRYSNLIEFSLDACVNFNCLIFFIKTPHQILSTA